MLPWQELVGVYVVGVLTPILVAAARELRAKAKEALVPRCPWCASRVQKKGLCKDCRDENARSPAAPGDWPRA